MQTITTSIRLTLELRHQLEDAAHNLHRGKNWIVSQALKEYLAKLKLYPLAEEAQRQSLLAKQSDLEADLWAENVDTSGWTA